MDLEPLNIFVSSHTSTRHDGQPSPGKLKVSKIVPIQYDVNNQYTPTPANADFHYLEDNEMKNVLFLVVRYQLLFQIINGK